MAERVLLEREAEIEALSGALGRAAGGSGQMVWLEGHAGVGKTSLLAAAIGNAASRGMSTLQASGDEFEVELPWGVVLQLFERRLQSMSGADRAALFVGPARHAHRLLLSAAEPPPPGWGGKGGDAGVSPAALNHGLLWLLANIAQRSPVLLVIDDLQWVDPSSLAFIAYVARRVNDLPVALVAASRFGVENETSGRRNRLGHERSAVRIVPPPLSPAAVAAVVRVARGEATDDLCAAAHRSSAGNAFLVDVVVRLLDAHAEESDDALRERLEHVESADLLHEVEARLQALPDTTSHLAQAVAVLGPSASPPVLEAVLGVTAAELDRRVVALARDDWVHVEHEAGGAAPAHERRRSASRVRFRHPLIRASVVALMDVDLLDQIHARVAEVLRDQGRPAEELVPHIVASRPRGRAASVMALLDAAGRARRSGAASMAVTLLRRAALEPPPAALAAQVHADLARAGAAANAPDVGRLFADAAAGEGDAGNRARLHFEASRALVAQRRYGEAAAALEQALGEDDGDDLVFSAELEASHLIMLRTDPARRAQWRPSIDLLVRETVEVGGELAHALAAELAYERGVRGRDLEAARRLALAAVADDSGTSLAFTNPMAWSTVMHALHQINEFARAAEVAGAVVVAAQEAGERPAFVLGSSYLAVHCLRLGRLDDALAALGGTGADMRAGKGLLVPMNAGTLSQTCVALNRFDLAREALALPGGEDAYRRELTFGAIPEAWGWMHLAEGDPVAALVHFGEIGRNRDGVGDGNPSTSSWRSGAARAHAALGAFELATDISAEEVELARDWGAPRQLGRALVTAGIVTPGTSGLSKLDDAVEVLAASDAVLDRAEAHLARGARQLQQGQPSAARNDLRIALDLATGRGALWLVTQAEAVLRAAGGRGRSRPVTGVEALTPSELRVARMAADGRANNDIAGELFVSSKAVEFHLGNAYRKLHIRGRGSLARALGGVETSS